VISLPDTPHLKVLFQKYMDIHLIGNQHLTDVLFHSFLGVVAPIKAYYAGHTMVPRTHFFPIQNSGTGKSQAGEALFWLLWFLLPHDKVFKCVKTTDAALIGSPDADYKKEAKQSRLLFKKEFIYWDEGSVLLKDVPFSEDLRDIMQMALDESRWIQKALKDGIVQGYTNATIVAGSYIESKIKYNVLRTGFFQRFIVTFKEYTDKEKLEIAENLERLEDPTLFTKKMQLQNEIKAELIKNYGFRYPVDIKERKVINFSHEASRKFTKEFMNYYKTNILGQYMDSRQDVLETVWSRVRQHTVKIAMHNAFLYHRDTLTEEDYDYAFDLVERCHIQGMKGLLDSISDEKVAYKKIDRASQKEFLTDCIAELCQKHNGAVTQTAILDYIARLKKQSKKSSQRPNFGRNRAWEWIKEMEKDGEIEVVKKEGHTNYIKLVAKK